MGARVGKGTMTMPPKKQFSKDQIVDAAFEIAREEGFDGLTVRKIAERLGSSVAPIYVSFENIDGVRQAVMERTQQVAREMMAATNTGDPFLDIGVASLRFAKEYSVLFRDMVLKENPDTVTAQQQLEPELIDLMASEPALAGFTPDELRSLFLKMRIFQLGLSIMVANKLLPEEFDEEAQIRLLDEVGMEIGMGIAMKKERAADGAATRPQS